MSGITEPTGYNHEDAAFKAKDAEKLAAIRATLDAKRKTAEVGSAKAAHWMCCPKCGGKMAEKTFENVVIDVCASCGGVYFDAGELELLIKHEKNEASFLGRFFRG
jgi:hypothetical protein